MSKDFNRGLSNGITAGREDSRWKDERIAELEARERELVEALRDCVGVMLERVYPKPDAPDSHPWNVTRRGQDLLAKIDKENSDG